MPRGPFLYKLGFGEDMMSNKTMNVILVQKYGGPETLEVTGMPIPEPKDDQVCIKMKAAGVNPIDWKLRSGMLKDYMPLVFPWIPGSDGAGEPGRSRPGQDHP
jgi:D-arabinose 1-dehydrogenase-like Zn-dependent alcohol dehydrogenase